MHNITSGDIYASYTCIISSSSYWALINQYIVSKSVILFCKVPQNCSFPYTPCILCGPPTIILSTYFIKFPLFEIYKGGFSPEIPHPKFNMKGDISKAVLKFVFKKD